MPVPREQLRLTPAELDELMGSAREAHVATVSPDGRPHVVPLWFVWLDGSIWVNSLRRSRRARDLAAGSFVSVCVDAGTEYAELRGATFSGSFEEAGDGLQDVRRLFAGKYFGGVEVPMLRSHVWLRLIADKMVTWDFRKIPAGRDKRLESVKTAED